jgi:hypothetical protein
MEPYKQLVQGLDDLGKGLVAIGESEDNPPIKLLVAQLVEKLGLNNVEIGDLVSMISFAVENDDLSLEKLTAKIAGTSKKAEPKD